MNESICKVLSYATRNVRNVFEVSAYTPGPRDDEIYELGVLSGGSSRFACDPNIPRQRFQTLYKMWVANCVAGSQADAVFVSSPKENTSDVTDFSGMVCVKKMSDGSGCIVLLSVNPKHQRQGIGRMLISHAFQWFFRNRIWRVTVTTQRENISAASFYESCGGTQIDSSVDIHLWIRSNAVCDPLHSDIPNTQPFICEYGKENVKRVLETGMIHTHWEFGPMCEALLEKDLGTKKCLLTTSGTSALELSALAIGCARGDEVIMPAFTFVSTATAFVNHGAIPVFVDIRRDTQNIDETKVEEAITPRTRAIVCVHYAGVSCEMDTILSIARKYNIFVIEDNAHGLYGTYKGQSLGSIGDIGCLSFHYTKNFNCGEGGAVLVNNVSLVQKAMIAWEKGTNRYDFLQGRVSKYYWVNKGGSFVLSELNAALLYGQLTSRKKIQESRMYAWEFYHNKLKDLEDDGKLVRPMIPGNCGHNAHIYYIRLVSKEDCERLVSQAKECRIGIFTHYEPLNLSAGGERYALTPRECPQTVICSWSLHRLPIWVGISDAELNRVVQLIQRVLS